MKKIYLWFFLLILVTGMNSHAHLILCYHANGTVCIVSVEVHDKIHHRADCSRPLLPGNDSWETDCPGHDLHRCFDVPLLRRNIAFISSGNIGDAPAGVIRENIHPGDPENIINMQPLRARLFGIPPVSCTIPKNMILLI